MRETMREERGDGGHETNRWGIIGRRRGNET